MVRINTADEVMRRGLLLGGMSDDRQRKQERKTNVADFKASFGVKPIVLAVLWEELQTTNVADARIDRDKYKKRSINLKNFLRAHHFLYRYWTETERKITHGNCRKTIKKWCWYFLEKIRAMKAVKIKWPNDGEWYTSFIVSVDGVHCRFHEVKHAVLSKDPNYYSWKNNGPGLSYELALSIFESKLVWVRKHPITKENDRANCEAELRAKIPDGCKAVTDRGYRKKGGDPKVALPKSYDPEELRVFKARARMRQEKFHRRIKTYNSMTDEFRHSKYCHQLMFESICVILCYEMELVAPLFDV